jgi:hypothetical protein
VPDAPLDTVIQFTALVAVHVHAGALAVTAAVAGPPDAPLDCVVGEIVYVQVTPLCVTVTVCPATVSVPVRLVVAVFAATE